MISEQNENVMENATFGVDSRYTSQKESQTEATKLMEARLERMKNVSKNDIICAKLMQLKLQMETFIKKPMYNKHHYFTEFLEKYIDIIYSKRSVFATDLNITPSKLSQVINNHREPQDEFMLKLMIHSEKIYENVCSFQKEIWYQVYFHEKLCKTMSTQKEWTSKLENVVCVSEPIAKYKK